MNFLTPFLTLHGKHDAKISKNSTRFFFTLHNIPFSSSSSSSPRKKSETNMSKKTHTRVILRILPRKKDKNKNPQPVKLVSSLALSSSLVLVIYLFNLNFVSFCVLFVQAQVSKFNEILRGGEAFVCVPRSWTWNLLEGIFLFSVPSRFTLTFLSAFVRLSLEILRVRVNEKENSFDH